jgi:hypothetical protein
LEEVFLTIAENVQLKGLAELVEALEDGGDEMPDNTDLEKTEVPESKVTIEADEEEIKDLQSNLEHRTVSSFSQFKALFIKSALLQSRDRKTNACQLLTPFVFVAILFLFDLMINALIGKTDTLLVTNPSKQFDPNMLSAQPQHLRSIS